MSGTSGASQQIAPDVFLRAMQASLSEKAVFLEAGSNPALAAAIDLNPSMAYGAESVNNLVRIPAFTNLGDFQDVGTITNDGTGFLADGSTAIAIQQLGMTETFAQVRHALNVFNITAWARANPLGDPYVEGARQAAISMYRYMDAQAIAAACGSTIALHRDGSQTVDPGLVLDVYSSSSPRYMDYDLACDAFGAFREFQEGIVGVMVHPKVRNKIWKIKDAMGRPLYASPTDATQLMFQGVPIFASGRLPVQAASAMNSVVSTGTSPPVITLTGTPNVDVDLVIQVMKAGALGTSKIRWSVNGGTTWVQDGDVNVYPLTASTLLLTDTRGNSTGVTINIAAGSASLDNVYTASTNAKYTSLVIKKKSIAFWYNKNMMAAMSVPIPILNAEQTALHVYCAAARYVRTPDAELPGVVKVFHN